jgi:hypothetical protein
MTSMNAAVVTSFAEPPHYQPFEVPVPSGDEVLADVLAVGLHPRVRSGAAGHHYTSSGTLPMIPAGADEVVQLTDDAAGCAKALAAAAAETDIVVDYLWGLPATQAIPALLTARSDRSRALDWIQIGSVAGPTIELPSAALRSANFRLQGSGQGSVSPRTYLAELPSLIEEITAGTIAVQACSVPLADVERAWTEKEVPGERIVLVP